ncbi:MULTISPECIES: hypothetical protein [Aneurinibacillus]|jgi:hypothetical protein|uniref:Uncharacterized protein n=1 Tax=Aneurinibacillus danicus TaxID=267746 RepID=A0A511V8I0_9BACL|nr:MULTISPECIES: hypothetical protein [Aneurinibacillus]GEN33512.1 hypothetical protein ADA01nite_09720 [Aneurinibacillus danicus]
MEKPLLEVFFYVGMNTCMKSEKGSDEQYGRNKRKAAGETVPERDL